LNTRSKDWLGYLFATLAGAIVTLSLAPFNLWPLGIISTALLAWLLAGQTPLQAAKLGWFYGLGLFGSGSSWVYVSIHVYGHASLPLAMLLTLIFSAGLALLTSATCYAYTRWLRSLPTGQTLGFATAFVLGEWLRSWFLTGFPWLYLGYAHLDTPLAGWAPVAGVFAISFIVALSGAVIANGVKQRSILAKPVLVPFAIVILLWLTGFALKQIDWVYPADKPPVKIAMVQANIPQDIKWDRDQYWPTLKLYQQMSASLWDQADIVIWPEAAIPGIYQVAKPFLDEISEQAAAANTSLITGLPYYYPQTDTQPARYHNSVMALGAGSGTYHKQRLVPFGEYVPLEGLLRGLIDFFDLPMSAFTSGSADQALLTAGDITLAPLICYEVVYPDLSADWLPQADMLLTISNDAWFGHSIGPLQHLQMAQMRALEGGRYMLRATSTGISAIIDQRGHITTQGQQFSKTVITGEALVYSGTTPFARFGNRLIIVVCFAIGISLMVIAAKMRRKF